MGVNNPGPMPIAEGRPAASGTNSLSVPGVAFAGHSTKTMTVDRVWYQPMRTATKIVLANLWVRVTGALGTLARLGIYEADTDLQPGALVVDIGTIPTNGIAVVTLATTQSLGPGNYLIACTCNSSPTFGVNLGAFPTGMDQAMGDTDLIVALSVAKAYGVLSDPGTAWDTQGKASTPYHYFVLCEVGTP